MINTSVFQNKKAAYFTLGCKLNFSETSTFGKMLADLGVRIAGEGDVADICLVNTCSVTEVADHKCRQAIHRLRCDLMLPLSFAPHPAVHHPVRHPRVLRAGGAGGPHARGHHQPAAAQDDGHRLLRHAAVRHPQGGRRGAPQPPPDRRPHPRRRQALLMRKRDSHFFSFC